MFKYFRAQPWREHPLMSAAMACLLTNDTYATANEIYIIYTYGITNWGNVAFLATQPWSIAAFCLTAGVSAAACQLFLVVRVHRFARSWLLTAPLALATVAAFAGAVWATV